MFYSTWHYLRSVLLGWYNGGCITMKVLIGCEYSGTVRDAFIKLGHDAVSCDLLPTDKAGPHIVGDVFELLQERWDLIIMHPPCTALAVSGNAWYGEGKPKYNERLQSAQWTSKLWEACKLVSDKVCFENPVGVLARLTDMPKANYIQPYQFGHTEQKKTGLFLYGLEPLQQTENVYDAMMLLPKRQRERIHYLPPSADRWKIRSTTYQGIADAMANQWGAL
tara:strand:+ start:778 stop:1443 length:666 start_codon:yes stop_codon:yes gene_type:complete